MSKVRQSILKLHWVHIGAAAILSGYFILSKLNFVAAVQKPSVMHTFIQLLIFGSAFSVAFLYIFSHEHFFPFAREIEKKERQKEQKYLKRYLRHGKLLTTLIVGTIGGPVFSSLTARLLLNSFKFKYVVVIIANIISTAFSVVLSRGILHITGF